MKIHNVHERTVASDPEAVAALFADMEQLWPTPEFPAPKPEGDLLRMGAMLWQPVERAGAVRAWDLVGPENLSGAHWFELDQEPNGNATLRHTIDGEAVGDFEHVWRDRIEPMHNAYIEAVFDRAQEALA